MQLEAQVESSLAVTGRMKSIMHEVCRSDVEMLAVQEAPRKESKRKNKTKKPKAFLLSLNRT